MYCTLSLAITKTCRFKHEAIDPNTVKRLICMLKLLNICKL